MSDIKLTQIIAPELGSDSYGANIKKQFENIDSNFTQIVEGEYLKGQSGDLVMLEEIDLTTENQNHEIRKAFDAFIGGLQVGDNGIGNEGGDINSSKLYMIYTLNQETGEKIYKTSLPYTFLDPRFNPVHDNVKNEELMDKSCIIVYDGGKFVSYNAFPNIYFNEEQNEFCWKINGLETPLPARGPRGETGYAGSFYVLQAEEANMEDGYYKVSFIITPEAYKGYLGVIQGEGLVSELVGQCAFVYHENRGYLTTIEKHKEGDKVYAKCRLDSSLNVYNIFSGHSLVDVLRSNTVEKNGYGSLFLPAKESNGQVLAHTLTTKLAGDIVGKDADYQNITKKEDLVLSPGIFKKVNDRWVRSLVPADVALAAPFEFINNYPLSRFPHKTVFDTTETNVASFNKTETNEATISKSLTIGSHTGEGTTPSVNGNLTVFDKMTVGCESSYYDETDGKTKPYNFGELWVGSTINIGNNTGVLRTGEIQIGEAPWTFSTQRTSEHISILKLSTLVPWPQRETQLFQIDSIVDIPRILSTSIDELSIKSVWPSQQSLYIPYELVNNPMQPEDIMPETFVYLTWGSLDGEIPHDSENDNYSDAEHKYLSLGDSQYLLYTHGLKQSVSGRKFIPSTLNLTFDLSKPIPYTVIDVACDSPLKSISFAHGSNVNIYCSGLTSWTQSENTEIIKVESGKVKTINFDATPKLDDNNNYVEDANGNIVFETLTYDKIILSPITADESETDSMDYMLSIESRNSVSLDKFISKVIETKVAVAANTLSLGQFNRIATSINIPQASTFSLRSTPVQTEEEELDSEQITQNFIESLNGRLDPSTLADSLVATERFALASTATNLNTDVENLRIGLEEYKGKIFDTDGNFKPSVIKDAFDNDDDNPSPFILNVSTGKLQLKPQTVSAATVQSVFKLDGSNNSPFLLKGDKLEFNPEVINDSISGSLTVQNIIDAKVATQIGDKITGLTPSSPTIDTSNFVKQGDLVGYMTRAELGINEVTSFPDIVRGVVNTIDLTPTIKTTFGIKDGETFEDKVLGTLGVTSTKSFETVVRDAIGLQGGQTLDQRISAQAPKIDESKFLTISDFNSEKSKLDTQILNLQSIEIPTWETLAGKPNILTVDGFEAQISSRGIVTSNNFVASFNDSTLAGKLALKTELPKIPSNIVTSDNFVTSFNEKLGDKFALKTDLKWSSITDKPTIPTSISDLTGGAKLLTEDEFKSSFDGEFARNIVTLGIVTNETVGTLMTSATSEALENNPTFNGMMKSVYKTSATGFEKDADGNYIPKVLTSDDVKIDGNTLTIGGTSKTLFSGSYNNLTDKPTIPTINGTEITYGSNKIIIPTKVSQLTDAGDYSKFSGNYADLTGKPTIPTIDGNTITYGSSSMTVVTPADLNEGYILTDFCDPLVRYLEGNSEVPREKYLQWPIKGNVIRGVYHPDEPSETLSMQVSINPKSNITINGITVNVSQITIDGKSSIYGADCSYGDTKTLKWVAKLVGDSTSIDEAVKNFKTTVSGYLTLTYTN